MSRNLYIKVLCKHKNLFVFDKNDSNIFVLVL